MTIVSLIIALEMDLLCVFLPVLGLWTVAFVLRERVTPSTRKLARLSAEVTHNHPEGIKGAMATTDAIFLCRYYFGGCCGDYEQPINDNPTECKRQIKDYIEQEYGYNLSQTLDEIRPNYRSMKPVRIPYPKPLLHFWKVETSKMLYGTPFPLVAIVIHLLQLLGA